MVPLFLESGFDILSAVEDSEDGDYIACDFKGYADAAAKAEDTEAGADIVPLRASHGKGLQAFALFDDSVGVAGCDPWRGCLGDVEEQSQELSFRLRGIHDGVHHPARRAHLRATASEARTWCTETARDGSAFMAS